MTENCNHDKYITCTRCKCKYINDDAHIQTDFGFTRLGERLKTCTTCREKRHGYYKRYNREHNEQNKQYYQDNKDDIIKRRETL